MAQAMISSIIYEYFQGRSGRYVDFPRDFKFCTIIVNYISKTGVSEERID